ncbi:hypothetical protein BOX15_Mlig024105g1, partial [Macrostomum lignano]
TEGDQSLDHSGDDSHSQFSGLSLRRSQSLQPSSATADIVTNEARTLLEIFLTRSFSVNLAEHLSAVSEKPSFIKLLELQDTGDGYSDVDGELTGSVEDEGVAGSASRPVAYSDPGDRPMFPNAIHDPEDSAIVEGNVVDADEADTQQQSVNQPARRPNRRRRQRVASTNEESNSNLGGEDPDNAVFNFDEDRRPRASTDSAALFISPGLQSAAAARGSLFQRAFNVSPSPTQSPTLSSSSLDRRRREINEAAASSKQRRLRQRHRVPLRKDRIVKEFGRACHQPAGAELTPSDCEDRLDHVAAMLDFVAKDFFEPCGSQQHRQRQPSVPFCLDSALQAKEDRVLRGRGTDGKPPVDDATLESLLSSLADYEAFSQRLSHLLLGDLQAWRCVAMLYVVTRLLCQRCAESSQLDLVKRNCLRHFDQRYAQWVLQRGGWQAVVDETEDSELD